MVRAQQLPADEEPDPLASPWTLQKVRSHGQSSVLTRMHVLFTTAMAAYTCRAEQLERDTARYLSEIKAAQAQTKQAVAELQQREVSTYSTISAACAVQTSTNTQSSSAS
jgi:hypothetical protein